MKLNSISKSIAFNLVAKYWLLFFAILVGLGFGIAEHSYFQINNLLNILSSACLTGIAGIGLTCIMAAGELDFSAGTELTLGAVCVLSILKSTPIHNYFIAVILTLLILFAVGLVNAFLHIKIGIPAFIATMGTSYALNGINKWLTNGKSMLGIGKELAPEFTFIGQGYLFGIIPMPLIMLVIVGFGMLIYTERTRAGKYLYAVGSNPAACKYIGIDANIQKLKGFVLCSVLCGFSGIIQGSMVNGTTPTIGDSMMISAITVLMLGATFMKMGIFNIPGTIVGAVLMAIINTGLTMIGAEPYVKNLVQGTMLFAAVSVVVIVKKKISKAI